MHKKLLYLFFFTLFTLGFSQVDSVGLGSNLYEERIVSFDATLKIDTVRKVEVTEKISANVLGHSIKRGIFRSLPTQRDLNGKKFRVHYDVISVKREGKEEKYRTKYSDGYFRIYVGEEDVLLPSGIHQYELRYSTSDIIGFFDNYDEFYWNVNGTTWDFPTGKISASVILPSGAKILQHSCYTGRYGSSDTNCVSHKESDHAITFQSQDLKRNEGLTIAVGFEKGLFPPPPPPTFLEKYGVALVCFLTFLGLMAYYILSWRKHGVDPEKPIPYPQFSSPENLSPASIGYIAKEGYKTNSLTASIVNLAIKGFLKIEESTESGLLGLMKKKVFTLHKLKPREDTLPKEEAVLLEALFTTKNSLELDGKYDPKVESAMKRYRSSIQNEHHKLINEGNNRTRLIFPMLLVSIIYALSLWFSYTHYADFGKIMIGVVLYMFFFVLFIVSLFIQRYGVIALILWLLCTGFFVFLFVSLSGNLDFSASKGFNYSYLFLILSFSALLIYQYLIRRPSEEKLQKQSLIEGFKMYMGAAENEQIKFHNPPELTPEVFERLLPFAMVLGVDQIWGEKFENRLLSSGTAYKNQWFLGQGSFSPMFATHLNSSLSSSIVSASSQPSSSSSGSGGGGFSGGGGGGGGGGGW